MYVKFQLRGYMMYIVPKPKEYMQEWEREGKVYIYIPGDPVDPLENGWVPFCSITQSRCEMKHPFTMLGFSVT